MYITELLETEEYTLEDGEDAVVLYGDWETVLLHSLLLFLYLLSLIVASLIYHIVLLYI
jgi:hypothetical protein